MRDAPTHDRSKQLAEGFGVWLRSETAVAAIRERERERETVFVTQRDAKGAI